MISGLEQSLIKVQDTTINVIKLHLAGITAIEISFKLKISHEEVLGIIGKFETVDLK